MRMALCFLAWEWINIALEYTTVAWTKLPRLGIAVVGVNLVTHPAFTLLLELYGREAVFVIVCEIVIFLVEWVLLTAFYGIARWRFLALVAFVMNAASYLTGILM